MVVCNCNGALAMGVFSPLVLCLLFYLGLLIYTFYYTNRYRSVDIKTWRNNRFTKVNKKYENDLEEIDDKIEEIERL